MEGYSPVSPKAVPTSPCGVDSRATSLTSEYKTKSVFKSALGCSLTAPIVVDAYPYNEASDSTPLLPSDTQILSAMAKL